MHVLYYAVGPAVVLIQPDASGVVVGTTRNLTCTIFLTNVADIIMMVDFFWFSEFKPLLPPRITTSLTTQSGNQSSFSSRLIFNPVLSSDTASYRCTVTVNANPVDVFVSPTTFTSLIEVQCKSMQATYKHCFLTMVYSSSSFSS